MDTCVMFCQTCGTLHCRHKNTDGLVTDMYVRSIEIYVVDRQMHTANI
jgi:hypothetical protein